MGPIGCPETLVKNYNYTLRSNAEERLSHNFNRLSPHKNPHFKGAVLNQQVKSSDVTSGAWL
jgi:hypothetical protein